MTAPWNRYSLAPTFCAPGTVWVPDLLPAEPIALEARADLDATSFGAQA